MSISLLGFGPAMRKGTMMPGYCGLCNTNYDCQWEDHEAECPGTDAKPTVAGSLDDYQQQTGDYGLLQAPEGFDWNEAQDQLR